MARARYPRPRSSRYSQALHPHVSPRPRPAHFARTNRNLLEGVPTKPYPKRERRGFQGVGRVKKWKGRRSEQDRAIIVTPARVAFTPNSKSEPPKKFFDRNMKGFCCVPRTVYVMVGVPKISAQVRRAFLRYPWPVIGRRIGTTAATPVSPLAFCFCPRACFCESLRANRIRFVGFRVHH